MELLQWDKILQLIFWRIFNEMLNEVDHSLSDGPILKTTEVRNIHVSFWYKFLCNGMHMKNLT